MSRRMLLDTNAHRLTTEHEALAWQFSHWSADISRDHHLEKEVPQTPEAARYGVVVRLIMPTSSKLSWLVPVWECFLGHLFRTA